MKTLIKGGLCLALGWLANDARAQEIQWRAAAPKNAGNITVVSAQVNAPAGDSPSTTGPATLGLSRPTPLDGVPAIPAEVSRPVSSSFAPIARGQVADDKTVPRPLPKDSPEFTPPPPQPQPAPGQTGPVLEALGSIFGGDCGTGCGTGCGLPSLRGGDCGPNDRARFWMSAEYLMWWQRAQTVPTLVTSSPAGGPAPLLGLPTTTALYDSVPNDVRSGARFSLGMWMPHFNNNLGIEVTYFSLGRESDTETFGSNGNPQLGRPFNDVTPAALGGVPGANAEVFAGTTPGGSAIGSATIHTFSELWGIEANLRYKLWRGENCWIDVLGGYRFLSLNEGIDISESAQSIVGGVPGVHFQEQESFHTRNEFNGFQIGLDGEWQFAPRWFIGMTAKLAMGEVHQIININGSTTFTNVPAPIGNSVQQGALLATPTNIGRYTANRFGVLPEGIFKIGYDITPRLRVFVGYDFLFLSSVVRPGDQIDTNVNQAYRPSILGAGAGGGPREPAVPYQTTGYWAQGLNFGLMYRF